MLLNTNFPAPRVPTHPPDAGAASRGRRVIAPVTRAPLLPGINRRRASHARHQHPERGKHTPHCAGLMPGPLAWCLEIARLTMRGLTRSRRSGSRLSGTTFIAFDGPGSPVPGTSRQAISYLLRPD